MPTATQTASAPHNVDAERTIIGALLLDSDAIYKIDDRLEPNDFFDPVFRDIYAAIKDLAEQGTAIDFVTVADKIRDNEKIQQIGGSAFLARLANDVPTSSHVTHYADILLQKRRRRDVTNLGRRLLELSAQDDKTAEELTEIAEQQILKLSHQRTRDGLTQLADMASDRYDHYAMLYEADDPAQHYGIRTGFADLDDKFTGLAPGQFIVIAGRPGMGKTALALDISLNVAVDQNKSVAIFSLEMSKEEVFGRLLAKRLAVESWKLEKGNLNEEHFQRMGPVIDEFADYPLFVDDTSNTLVSIRSKARRHQMQHRLDLLVVDYLQLIEVTDRVAGENQNQRIAYISKSLKQLARELRIPVIALSQLSRECERRTDKRPQLSDLRDSGSIEQDGDRILMLYREGEYFEDCDDPDLTDVFIRKNRHGPKGDVELRFDRKRMTFDPLKATNPKATARHSL